MVAECCLGVKNFGTAGDPTVARVDIQMGLQCIAPLELPAADVAFEPAFRSVDQHMPLIQGHIREIQSANLAFQALFHVRFNVTKIIYRFIAQRLLTRHISVTTLMTLHSYLKPIRSLPKSAIMRETQWFTICFRRTTTSKQGLDGTDVICQTGLLGSFFWIMSIGSLWLQNNPQSDVSFNQAKSLEQSNSQGTTATRSRRLNRELSFQFSYYHGIRNYESRLRISSHLMSSRPYLWLLWTSGGRGTRFILSKIHLSLQKIVVQDFLKARTLLFKVEKEYVMINFLYSNICNFAITIGFQAQAVFLNENSDLTTNLNDPRLNHSKLSEC